MEVGRLGKLLLLQPQLQPPLPDSTGCRCLPQAAPDQEILERDGWRCQTCGSLRRLEVHHIKRGSQSGDDTEGDPITDLLQSATRHERADLDARRNYASSDRSVSKVISGGQPKRIGSKMVPSPRLVYTLSRPI